MGWEVGQSLDLHAGWNEPCVDWKVEWLPDVLVDRCEPRVGREVE